MKFVVTQSYVRRFHQRTLSTVSALALATAAMSAPYAAYAAEQNAAAAQAAEEDLGEVVVTGSRIIREGYEAPTPLSVVDVAAIQASATQNIAEFVNTMPVFSGSASPNTGQSSISSGAAICIWYASS